MKKAWRIWALALGQKADIKCNKTSDYVAIIRTIIVLVNVICALFIITNIVHNW